MSLHFEKLYTSDIVTVVDVRCRPHDNSCGAEECSTTNDIIFPRCGCFVRHLGRDRALADANTVQFFGKDQEYRVSHPVAGGDDCTCLTFAPSVLVEALAAIDPSAAEQADNPFHARWALSTAEAAISVQRLRRALRQAARGTSGSSSLRVDEQALGLLGSVAQAAVSPKRRFKERARPDTLRAHRDLADEARVVLFEHMGERLTLPMIARLVHSSPFHLARVFRRMTGLSLHEYLTRLRLRAALERLANGATDMTSLALSLGFSSHSHFSDVFRCGFRVAPSAIRRDLAAGRIHQMSTNLKASRSRRPEAPPQRMDGSGAAVHLRRRMRVGSFLGMNFVL